MVTHGGIPSHMVVNPEPNLRPTTMRPPSYMEGDHTSTTPVEGRNPVLMTDPGPDPTPGNPSSTEPGRGKPRTTIPVPVRSKQRVSSTVDPQPKKRQKVSTVPRPRHGSQLRPPWRHNITRHLHHSSRHLHTHIDTKPQGTSLSHLPDPSAKSS